MKTIVCRCLALAVAVAFASVSLRAQTVINEIRIHDQEYFELRGIPGTSLDNLWYLVIGDGSGSTSGLNGYGDSGVIEETVNLTDEVIPDSGYFLVAESNSALAGNTANLQQNLNFENFDNVTHVLAERAVGASPPTTLDFDTNDDGHLEMPLPWLNVLDAVGLMEVFEPEFAGQEWVYGSTIEKNDGSYGVNVGPNSGATPQHVFRAEREDDTWHIGTNATANGFYTPGSKNPSTIPLPCDFSNNGICNVRDINLMYAEGNLAEGVAVLIDNDRDLTHDQIINAADINRWLVQAAESNGYGTRYLRGDTDDLGKNYDAVRDVDITDFNNLATNFGSMEDGTRLERPFWHEGNFDGDFDIDITDFNYLAGNFAPNGYNIVPVQPPDIVSDWAPGQSVSVPEPSVWWMLVGGLLFFAAVRGRLTRGVIGVHAWDTGYEITIEITTGAPCTLCVSCRPSRRFVAWARGLVITHIFATVPCHLAWQERKING